MCEFISWVERRDKVLFLTGDQLFRTKKGRKFLETISRDDLCGHGTIRAWYGIDSSDGKDKECTDFSSPKNFPTKIVAAVKQGKMRGIGIERGLLTQPALAEYEKVEQQALDEYEKVRQQAFSEYKKVTQPAWDEYEKVGQPARAEYKKVEQPAWDEYGKVGRQAWAEYEKIKQQAFWDLFAIPETRNPVWRD